MHKPQTKNFKRCSLMRYPSPSYVQTISCCAAGSNSRLVFIGMCITGFGGNQALAAALQISVHQRQVLSSVSR